MSTSGPNSTREAHSAPASSGQVPVAASIGRSTQRARAPLPPHQPRPGQQGHGRASGQPGQRQA